jgi:hypothetical protein
MLAATTGPAGGSTLARCLPGQMRIAAGAYGEAAGQFTQTLTFTNTSRRSCAIAGWPRIEVAAASRGRVPVGTRRVVQGAAGARPFATVVLLPRGSASFDVYGPDWNVRANTRCPSAAAALVTLPSGGFALRVKMTIPLCPGGLDVAPVIAGRADRRAWSFVWTR